MADNIANIPSSVADSTPQETLASAYTAASGSLTLTGASKPTYWPSTPYRLTVFDATNGDVTFRVSAESWPSVTVAVVEGSDHNFAAGSQVEHLGPNTAGGFDDRVNVVIAADTTKQAADSDLTTIAGLAPANDDFLQRKSSAWANRTLAQVRTDLYAAVIGAGAAGTAAAPFYTRSTDLDTGGYFSAANEFSIATNGTQKLRIGSATASFMLPLSLAGSYNMSPTAIGSTLNLSLTTHSGLLVVTAAPCTINLFSRSSWTATPPVYNIIDPLKLLSGVNRLTINAYDQADGFFNDINGKDAVYGAWNDSFLAAMGPFGASALLSTAGGYWVMEGAYGDTGSGAVGGWNIVNLGNIAAGY